MKLLKTFFFLLAFAAVSLAAAEVKPPDVNELKAKAKAEWTAGKYAPARDIFRNIVKLDEANASKHAAEIVAGVPSGNADQQLSFYRIKAEIAMLAKNTAMRDQAYADALKLKDLTPAQQTTVLLLPIDSYGATVSKSFDDVEKLCRDALKVVGSDKESRSRIWEKFCIRAQHRNYYTPPHPKAIMVFEEALKQDLTPRVRFNITNYYRNILLYQGRYQDALKFSEEAAEKMDDNMFAAYLFIAAGNLLANPTRYMNNMPDEQEYLKAMVYFNRALEKMPDMLAAYEAIITLCAKTHRMEPALTAYGKIAIAPRQDSGLKNRMALALAVSYFEQEDFAGARAWLDQATPKNQNSRIAQQYYNLSMRLACIDGDFRKASDELANLEKCTGDFIQKQKLKRYRQRMNQLLREQNK